VINLANLKKDQVSSAAQLALPIFSEINNKIGILIPIGAWALENKYLLNEFANWRKVFMRLFLVQFTASVESTKSYLTNLSIAQKDRIFFAIYDADNQLVGHIGLSHITSEKAELDNIIRGRSARHTDIMYFAEKTLLSWAFEELLVKRVEAQVISKNFMVMCLHERFGFMIKKSMPLKKEYSGNTLRYITCPVDETTEKFHLNLIQVARQEFYESIQV
jgi:perosamine synthetase